ncbi:MAG: glycosyl hydrolase family 88 [Provencibacterium sp.]|jgi:unsaturated chondroitin disaccharide hydrolase|nr:glycosyl hydrolase family 88 [Provencibacterium sp.]
MEEKMGKCSNQEWLDGAYDKLLLKMKAECARIGTMIPYTTGEDGKYHDITETPWGNRDGKKSVGFWTNGFWPGMLWQMYEATGDEAYKSAAVGVEERLDVLLKSPETVDHDVGFLFLLSSVANYRKTGDADARRRGLLAASTLAARYNLDGKFLRAWNGPRQNQMTKMMGGGDIRGWMIIDCMMNIPLLYWAAKELDDPRFEKIAVNHAKTAQQYIARPDGSCNHIVAFDPDTGEYLNNPGGQGYQSGSSWSRGQAWAVYGFALSYRHTGERSFLDTAKSCAHYCIANMAVSDWLPLVDYRQPEQPLKYDSTAAMITVCGLLEIAEHVDKEEARFYTGAAYRILRACDERFVNWDPQADSIVDGGTFFYNDPTGQNTEIPIIYADYYFIEAILRLKGKSLFVW